MKNLMVFGLNSTKKYAERVAGELGKPLCTHEEHCFDDGEAYLRSRENVRGRDVFVIQSLYTCEKESVSDKLTKLLIFLGSLRDASAKRITAVIPYLSYQRQDRKTESRAPIVTKYQARWFEASQLDRLLTIDAHNLAALQNSFNTAIPDHLEAKKLMAQHVAAELSDPMSVSVMSPDVGGMNRARLFRNVLAGLLKTRHDLPNDFEIPLAVLDKTHVGRSIKGNAVIGDVSGRDVVFVDDMISGGKTMSEARKAVERAGGKPWGACATHGLFVGGVAENLTGFERIVITDTINRPLNGEAAASLKVISTAKLVASAIRRIHEEDSISDLLA